MHSTGSTRLEERPGIDGDALVASAGKSPGLVATFARVAKSIADYPPMGASRQCNSSW